MTTESIQRHERTGAARTTTSLEAEATPRTVRQVLGDQKPDQTIDRDGNIHRQAIVPVTPAPTSEAALERNLAEEAGPGGRLCAHNLQDGYLRTLDDGVRIKEPWRVRAHLAQPPRLHHVQHGWAPDRVRSRHSRRRPCVPT